MRARIVIVAAVVAGMVGLAAPAAVAGQHEKPKKDKQCIALVIGGQQGDGICVPLP
jgi:hypothetical protein